MIKNNILYVFSFVILLLNSYSSKAQKEDIQKIIAPKKILYENINYPSANYFLELTYDGNKIESIFNSKDKSKTLFTYSGDFVSAKKVIYNNSNYSSIRETYYSYENNKLKEVICDRNSYIIKYLYRNDQSILYTIDSKSTQKLNTRKAGEFIINNGNIIGEKQDRKASSIDGRESNGYNDQYKYDTKNNPLKNVLGISYLLDDKILPESLPGQNNVIQKIHNVRGVYTLIMDRKYTYNKNGYPLTEEYSENNKPTHFIIKYIYQ